MAAYLDQFATAFLVVGGSQPFSEEDALALLAPLLREGGFSSSVYPTIKAMEVRMAEDEEFGGGSIVSGPWTGTETTAVFPILTALKWNLRTRTQGAVTSEMLGAMRNEWRTTRRSITADGFTILTWSLQKYGRALAGDHGVPATPPLPAAPSKRVLKTDPILAIKDGGGFPWAKFIGGVAAVAVLANMDS